MLGPGPCNCCFEPATTVVRQETHGSLSFVRLCDTCMMHGQREFNQPTVTTYTKLAKQENRGQ